MKKHLITSLKLALGLLAVTLIMGSSCITTGNVMVVEYIDDFDAQTETNLDYERVDLTTNSDWQEHRDDIAGIDDMGFACRITNNANSPATGQLYLYDPKNDNDSLLTISEVQQEAIKVLDGIVVPAGETREIEWQESYDYLENFDDAKNIIFSEKFQVYFIAANTPFNIRVTDIVLFLSINGKAD